MYGLEWFKARRRRVDALRGIVEISPRSAPRLVVNTSVNDVEVQEVDVYEMLHEIEEGGTCVVHVPDVKVLLALDSIVNSMTLRIGLKFSEVCYPTYLCHSLKEYLEQLAVAQAKMYRRWGRLARSVHEKFIPPSIIYAPSKPPPWMMVKECTTIGSPYTTAIWDYFLGYPPDLTPQELTTLLHEKKLKFIRVLPKIETIENPLHSMLGYVNSAQIREKKK
jgi:hypothetical protein